MASDLIFYVMSLHLETFLGKGFLSLYLYICSYVILLRFSVSLPLSLSSPPICGSVFYFVVSSPSLPSLKTGSHTYACLSWNLKGSLDWP